MTQEFLLRIDTARPIDQGELLRSLIGFEPLSASIGHLEIMRVRDGESALEHTDSGTGIWLCASEKAKGVAG